MGVFKHTKIVEFHETDAAGLVHFSNYFRYAESAEHALFREINYSMMKQDAGTFFGWPRVRAQIKYSAPLYSGDSIRVELCIEEIKDKAIEYSFRIIAEKDDVLVAKGTFSTLHVRFDGFTREMKTVPIGGELRDLLQAYTKPSESV